jgi:hypothetical protein
MKFQLNFRQTLTLLSTNVIRITLKNPVLISHKIGYCYASITETNCKLFRKIIAVYSESHTKHKIQCGKNAEILNVKVGETYSNLCCLKNKSKMG